MAMQMLDSWPSYCGILIASTLLYTVSAQDTWVYCSPLDLSNGKPLEHLAALAWHRLC